MSISLLQRHAINWRKGSRTSPLLRPRATRLPGQKQTTCFTATNSAKQHPRTTLHTRYEALCWQTLARQSVCQAAPCNPRHRRSCEVGLVSFGRGTDYLEHTLRRHSTDIMAHSCYDICMTLAPCRWMCWCKWLTCLSLLHLCCLHLLRQRSQALSVTKRCALLCWQAAKPCSCL